MSGSELSHLDSGGNAQMVDVSRKTDTARYAAAQAEVSVNAHTLQLIREGLIKKGDVFTVAQLAGILAAKQTGHLIPLCHPLILDQIQVHLRIDDHTGQIVITSEVSSFGKTGVEMEALTAVSIAALTIYDMVKAVQKNAVIRNIHLLEKRGGKSGEYHFEQEG
ncbi:MAG: cyclic pyranopterin monophosphate synthase MoaC [Anaerolineaceae bacterium]